MWPFSHTTEQRLVLKHRSVREKTVHFEEDKLFFVKNNTPVVLENNNGHFRQLAVERLLLFHALLPSRQEVFVSCLWVGPGEPGSADGQSVRPSAW
jgi:hypothetical protein